MKVKVIALIGGVNKGKKNPDSGMVNACVQYPDGSAGVHVIYHEDIAQVRRVKVGDTIDIRAKMEEFCFLEVA